MQNVQDEINFGTNFDSIFDEIMAEQANGQPSSYSDMNYGEVCDDLEHVLVLQSLSANDYILFHLLHLVKLCSQDL